VAKKAKKKVTRIKSDLPARHQKKVTKKRVRKNKPKIRSDEHEICDGEVRLFRTTPSGDVFQFQMWIPKEQKYIRKSTRKRDLEDAKEVARRYWKEAIAKIELEQPIFALTATELVERFLESAKQDVGITRTQGRWETIRSQLSHYLDFVTPSIKTTDIDRNIWDGYYRFRRDNSSTVQDVTLRNEVSTIRSMYKFAIRHEYLTDRYLPYFPALKVSVSKRRALEVEEYRTIYEHLRSKEWSSQGNDREQSYRKFLYFAVIVLANTGIRFGEMRCLRWENIGRISKDENGHQVIINLNANQTKNKKERTVVGRRGDIFRSIKKHSNFTQPSDYVFVDNFSETGDQLHKDRYYRLWNEMLDNTGLQETTTDNISFYNLRHFYATQRLYAGTDPYSLAKSMGCGLDYLWNHYGQVQTERMAKNLTQKVKLDKDGQVIL
jgi:integrase